MNEDNKILKNKESLEKQNLFSIASQELEEENNNKSENIQEEEISFGNLFHFVEENETTEIKETQNVIEQPIVEEKKELNPTVAEELPKEEKVELENKESQTPVEQPIIEEKEEINPFVTVELPKEEKQELENKEPQTPVEQPIIEEKEEINPFVTVELPKEEKQELENIKENNNPFFANNPFVENNEQEINPIFNNKIELNEKTNYKNNTGNKLVLNEVPHYNVKVQKKKPKKSKMIIGVLSYAIFIWLLLIGITLLIYVANIKIKEMKGDYTPPKYNAYVVLTGSMLPQIEVEDVVVTKRIDAEKLKEGDIITFASTDERYYGTIITHRIMKKYYDSTTGKYTFQSKGDNNNVADNALVQEDKIYGKVILKIPKLGYLQVFLASKGGWILVILIPCAVVISFDIMKLFKMIAMKRKLKIVK